MSEHHTVSSPFTPSPESLDEWRMALTSDMSEVKTMLHTLCGNGQPGTVGKLEVRVSALERARDYMAGAIAVASAIGGYFLHGVIAKGGQ